MKNNSKNKSNNPSELISKLKKYALGSQGLIVASGLAGITTNSSAVVTAITAPTLLTTTLTFTSTANYNYNIALSTDPNDSLFFASSTNFGVYAVGAGGAQIIREVALNTTSYLGDSETVDNTGNFSTGYVFWTTNTTGNRDEWTTDRTAGVIGFKTGDNQYGFVNVNWIASTKTLTFTGGSIETTANTAITYNAAVPEPSEYAVALGLGALGLVAYRRKMGDKARARS